MPTTDSRVVNAAQRFHGDLARHGMKVTSVDTDGGVPRINIGPSDHGTDRRRAGRQAEAFTPQETGEAVAADDLRSLVERIEKLEEEKKAIADDVKDVYAEAKGRGFDTKAIRAIVRLRAMEPHEREEQEAILDLYRSALGL